MKYEMIFGDEKLFAGVPEYVEFIRYNSYSRDYLWGDLNVIHHLTFKDLTALPIVAMRRIIQEPKRWTMSDKISGEGPNIGDILMLGGLTVEFIGISLIDNYEWYVRHPSGRCESANFKYFYPSETPEEKAARLRSEWVSNVGVMIDRHCEGANVASVTVRNFIYDALLSGELPVPTKGGE